MLENASLRVIKYMRSEFGREIRNVVTDQSKQ